ncbi:hypothetical protein IW15_00615 [Chryseobacterium soli]|uniref:DUF4595 domain-containing protein n=1 Tax=Chryseobacterium soli TaxID=445961 RepID=A0A086ABC3_9FLAO|nr:hypothetical protein [Chryseobacterium soli]KFF13987.1 hypothetical protein IW15_00615 [Chryseobacterium soli]
MGKNYLLKILAGILFGFMISCDNTTSDPVESGGSGGNGTTPQDSRVLDKITVNNAVQEEYITTNTGILQKATVKDDNTAGATLTGALTYTSNKIISNIKFTGTATGSIDYDFNVILDSNGRVYSTSCVATAPTVPNSYISDFVYTYDATGKLTKVVEKRKVGGMTTYTVFTQTVLNYVGDNISQAVWSKGVVDGTGAPNMATATTNIYNFQNYDMRKSPYSTLPKAFFVVWSLIRPQNFYTISPNNPTSMYFMYPSPTPAVSIPKSYMYDSQSYPTSDQTQTVKYTYKTL